MKFLQHVAVGELLSIFACTINPSVLQPILPALTIYLWFGMVFAKL